MPELVAGAAGRPHLEGARRLKWGESAAVFGWEFRSVSIRRAAHQSTSRLAPAMRARHRWPRAAAPVLRPWHGRSHAEAQPPPRAAPRWESTIRPARGALKARRARLRALLRRRWHAAARERWG